MRLSTVLLATFVTAGLFGLGFLVLPTQVGAFYGMQTDANGLWLGRYFGATLIGIGVLAWFLRGVSETGHTRAVATGYLIYETLGLLLSLWYVFSPEGMPMLWLSVALYGLLALGFALALMRAPAATPAERQP